MIHPHDIQTLDFSLVLPAMADKLQAIQCGLAGIAYSDDTLEGEGSSGFAHILTDIIKDLRVVNKALYGHPDGRLPKIPTQEVSDGC